MRSARKTAAGLCLHHDTLTLRLLLRLRGPSSAAAPIDVLHMHAVCAVQELHALCQEAYLDALRWDMTQPRQPACGGVLQQ